MYGHPATRANVRRLREDFGYRIVEPEEGPLASGQAAWIAAVHENRSAPGFVESSEELERAALAGPGSADQRQVLPGVDLQ